MRTLGHFFISSLLSVLIYSCVSTPEKPKEISVEKKIEIDQDYARKIVPMVEPNFAYEKDEVVQGFLKAMTIRLAKASPLLSRAPVYVFILSDDGKAWKNFGLPSARVYLSKGLLKNIEYENELAAMISYELGHLHRRHVAQHYEAGRAFFEYTPEENLEAVRLSVQMMYQAGYDPRGLVAYWEIHLKNKASSPFPVKTIKDFIEKTREEIVQFSPLRDPIVRSNSFLNMLKRIKKL